MLRAKLGKVYKKKLNKGEVYAGLNVAPFLDIIFLTDHEKISEKVD